MSHREGDKTSVCRRCPPCNQGTAVTTPSSIISFDFCDWKCSTRAQAQCFRRFDSPRDTERHTACNVQVLYQYDIQQQKGGTFCGEIIKPTTHNPRPPLAALNHVLLQQSSTSTAYLPQWDPRRPLQHPLQPAPVSHLLNSQRCQEPIRQRQACRAKAHH